jgi:hypothetical protein
LFNYTTTAIVLLVRMKLLTEDAGKYLAENLQSKIHTSRYNDAFQMVDELLSELEAKEKYVLTEPWLPYTRRLERQIADLESRLAKFEKADTKTKVLTSK